MEPKTDKPNTLRGGVREIVLACWDRDYDYKVGDNIPDKFTDQILSTIYSSLIEGLPKNDTDPYDKTPYGEGWQDGRNQLLRDVKDRLERILK